MSFSACIHILDLMTPEEFAWKNMLPAADNPSIIKAMQALSLKDGPIYVRKFSDPEALFGECIHNVYKKVSKDGGSVVYGWRFCEYSYMIEGEFHAVWRNPEGLLVDITPDETDSHDQILFAIDSAKTFDGKRTDNFRLNTTTNPLVDDIIEIERAKFRFTDKIEEVDEEGRIIFNPEEQQIWNELNWYSNNVDWLFAKAGSTDSECFCGSKVRFRACHRGIVHSFLKTIV